MGLCYGCEGRPTPGLNYCARCRAKMARYQRDQRPHRLCPDCQTHPCEFQKKRCTDCKAKHAAKQRIRLREVLASQRHRLKAEVYAAYGGRCKHCGDTRLSHLCIDHVNDDGYLDRTPGGTRRTGTVLWRRVKREGFPATYQLLCFGCNLTKQVKPEVVSNSVPLAQPN